MLGDDLRELIDAEGVQYKDVAAACGIRPSGISILLRQDNASYSTVERVLDAIGYRIMWVRKDWEEETLVLDIPGKDRLTMEDVNLIKLMAQGLVAQKGGVVKEELIG